MHTWRNLRQYHWFIISEVENIAESWEAVGEIVSTASSDLEPAYLCFTKVGTFLFIRKIRKIYCYLRYNYGNVRLIRILDKLEPSDRTLERIPFLFGGYSAYCGVDGKIIPRPLGIFTLWKSTFCSCMRMSNKNQIVSCIMAFISIGLSLHPKYNGHNQYVMVATTMIRIAASQFVYSVEDVEEIINDLSSLTGRSYGLF